MTTAALREITDTQIEADGDAGRRRELGAFLRNRRERLGPEQVGLPVAGRRRTPGLRREEVAQVANVGVTWYTWLEQGRDIRVSESVLEALARGLLLDAVERRHLFRLAGATVTDQADRCFALAPATRMLLAEMRWPASVQNERFDLLAYNDAYALITPTVLDVPQEERNSLWLAFTNDAWRASLVDWEESAARLVAQFRSGMAERPGDPAWTHLLAKLQAASPEFCAMWERHEVRVPERGTKRLLHPDVGLLTFDFVNLWLCQRLNNRMCAYLPADEETRIRVEVLRGRRPQAA